MKKPFEYFEEVNPYNIYIEERKIGPCGVCAVWHNNSIIADCLSPKVALLVANKTLEEAINDGSL